MGVEQPLAVVTWNLSYEALAPPGVAAWTDRRDRIATLLRRFDLVALQELSGRQLADLTDRLPGYAAVAQRTPMPDALYRALSRRLGAELSEHDLGMLVPHTGFLVKCLMRLSRVYPVARRDA